MTNLDISKTTDIINEYSDRVDCWVIVDIFVVFNFPQAQSILESPFFSENSAFVEI